MSGCGRVKGTNKEATQLRALLKVVGVRTARDPKKIYERAIAKLHSEERGFACNRKHRTFTRLVEKCSTFRYPGLFNDYNSKTKDDDKTLLNIHRSNKRIRRGVKGRREYLKRLVQDMLKQTRSGRVKYTSDEKTALEVARGESSDCSELTRYAFARLRLAGFKPEVVLVENNREKALLVGGTSLAFHVMVAVQDPADVHNKIYIDLYNDGIVGEPQQKTFVAPRTLLSIYYQNKGIYFEELRDQLVMYIHNRSTHPGSSMFDRAALGIAKFFKDASEALALKHHSRAIHYNPTYAPALYSKAQLLWRTKKNLSEARILAARALKLMPSYQDAKRLFAIVSDD